MRRLLPFTFFGIAVIYTIYLFTYVDPSTVPQKRGQYIVRHSSSQELNLKHPKRLYPPSYPWRSSIPPITKEFFRCKGNILNPIKIETKGSEPLKCYDCGGRSAHGLPYHDQDEFVYPVLIDLLNYLQEKTDRKVQITCGHCCPQHNQYIHESGTHTTSKHQIGAEVDFYLVGMEYSPQQVVDLIQTYYKENLKYQGMPEYLNFKRYEKEDRDTSVEPWFNKEIYIKLYKSTEGRDYDNSHPFPYLSIQVKWDWDKKKGVAYSWPLANRNYIRS